MHHVCIEEQLRIEEALLRADDGNWCLYNEGTQPRVVMGLGARTEDVLTVAPPFPIIRRMSGGGTVIVDEGTFFLTFIGQKGWGPSSYSPSSIISWSAPYITALHPKLEYLEGDLVYQNKKCGGHALSITKDRWLLHFSLLWTWNPSHMQYLAHPLRTPSYRKGRLHNEFLFPLAELECDRDLWFQKFVDQLSGLPAEMSEIETIRRRPHRTTIKITYPRQKD